MSSQLPNNLKYTKSHEWIEQLDDETCRVGITDHAQDLLGDMVYVDLPEVGDKVSAGDECTVVESVKAASDVYSPLTGDIVAVNADLADTPERVNEEPFGAGWLFVVSVDKTQELEGLLSAADYEQSIADDE